MRSVPAQKTLVIPLFTDMFLQTDGTTSLTYTELDLPVLEGLGPYIESMFPLTVTRVRTTNHSWNIGIAGSNTGRVWSTPVGIIGADITANGEATQALYNTASTYAWRLIKCVVGCRNSTGSARETAQASAWLVVNLKT